MKRTNRILPAVTALVLLITALFSSCGTADVTDKLKIKTLESIPCSYTDNSNHTINKKNLIFVSQSGLIELYYDTVTAAVVVRETGNSKQWYSMPLSTDGDTESRACVLSAVVSKGDKVYEMNSQDNSVAFGASSFKPVSNGIQVTYNMGLDAETAQNGPTGEVPYASVTVNYTLSDGAMFAKVNCGEINVTDGYAIESVSLLNFFGASDKADNADFILVPDESGAVMMLAESGDEYNSKTFKVYGDDASVSKIDAVKTDADDINASAILGYYGMKQGNNAFVALIGSGDTIASVGAVRQSDSETYNRVGASFRLTDISYLGKSGKITKYVGKQYVGEISVCFRFLSNKNAVYSGMATACREQLIRNSVLSTKTVTSSEHLPFSLTLWGAACKNGGGTYEKLTTFEQAYDLLNMLKAKSVNSISLRYCGVLDGADNQLLLSDSSAIGKLGGKKSFETLKQYVSTQKFDMYVDLSMALFSRKAGSEQPAVSMTGKKIMIEKADKFSALSSSDTLEAYALSLSSIEKNIVNYVNSENVYTFDGYSVNDAGGVLYSDYSSEGQNRDNAVTILSSAVQKLSNGHKLSVDGGNFYLLKNADTVTGLSADTDYPQSAAYCSVPFAEMILHGIVDYSLTPVNLSSDSETAFLKALEYGAVPSYEWYYSKTGEASLDETYNYENQINKASENYITADSILGNLRNARMTAHYKVSDGVYCTEYNNSIIIYFNYNDFAAEVNSLSIAPKSAIRVN